MMGYPCREEAERLLLEAEACNPGPWGDHSRTAAFCAQRIASAAGMDPEKAYIMGLLHDIGRKFGVKHLCHVSDGYHDMMALGYPEAAKICLTHSFVCPTLDVYVGNRDVTLEQASELRELLEAAEYDDYDRLIQLCDCLAGAGKVMDMEARMADVEQRYGFYPQEKRDANRKLKAYFEEKIHGSIYEVLK